MIGIPIRSNLYLLISLGVFLVVLSFGVIASHPSQKLFAQSQTPANQYINEAFNSKAANLRLTLNNLLHEHTVMAANDLVATYAGEDTTRMDQLMNDNMNQLANLVQNGYGKNTHDTFVTLWMAHMKEYKNYTLASKNNDINAMNTSRNNLQNISNNLGKLFNSTNLPAATVSGLMMDHVNGTLAIVDAIGSNDMTQTSNLMKKGYDQAGKFADTLAKGIILDKPNLFK